MKKKKMVRKKHKKDFEVTPWSVEGKVDYDRLTKEFGLKLIDNKILERIKKHTNELHLFLRRKIFFAHRDLDWILDKYEQGEKFFLYTGRGPSGRTHIGHMIPWIFTKWLQDKFDCELYFQITDDEKFLIKKQSFEEIEKNVEENLLDIAAIGFNPEKTYIIQNTKDIKLLYKIAIKIARNVTYSTASAVFGFKKESNIGIIFFPALQASPCFLPSVLNKKNIPCLIPAAVDQDPYWRGIARYVAPKLGFYKPAQIHSKLLPGLKGEKMSSSEPESCIFTTDSEDDIERKVWKALTGGQKSLKEQKEKGGDPNICLVYKYLFYLFEENDEKIEKIYNECKSGERFCGDCKKYLADKIKEFLREHKKKRSMVKIEDYKKNLNVLEEKLNKG
ncbi:MAG: tryptophan--tRNA ligase [Candidatus Aenigmatarchaeota archaeon]